MHISKRFVALVAAGMLAVSCSAPAVTQIAPPPPVINKCNGMIVYADLYVYDNDDVKETEFVVDKGREQLHYKKGPGEYEVRILDGNDNLVWQERKDVYFYPENRDIRIKPSNIPLERVNVVSRIPYMPDMKIYELLHNGRVIYRTEIKCDL